MTQAVAPHVHQVKTSLLPLSEELPKALAAMLSAAADAERTGVLCGYDLLQLQERVGHGALVAPSILVRPPELKEHLRERGIGFKEPKRSMHLMSNTGARQPRDIVAMLHGSGHGNMDPRWVSKFLSPDLGASVARAPEAMSRSAGKHDRVAQMQEDLKQYAGGMSHADLLAAYADLPDGLAAAITHARAANTLKQMQAQAAANAHATGHTSMAGSTPRRTPRSARGGAGGGALRRVDSRHSVKSSGTNEPEGEPLPFCRPAAVAGSAGGAHSPEWSAQAATGRGMQVLAGDAYELQAQRAAPELLAPAKLLELAAVQMETLQHRYEEMARRAQRAEAAAATAEELQAEAEANAGRALANEAAVESELHDLRSRVQYLEELVQRQAARTAAQQKELLATVIRGTEGQRQRALAEVATWQ